MPGQIPNPVRLYRIVHIDNLGYLLRKGFFTRIHVDADPNYINIGDTDLIAKRNDYPVKVNPPNGLLGDYVPFYFGKLSPMLLKIKDGNKGVTKRTQNEIIYIVCNLEDILHYCEEWCFTNGHAKTAISDFYNDLRNLDEVDWDIVNSRYWSNSEEDFDRMRRKQAEFLIKNHVSVSCIKGIITYDSESKILVENIISNLALNIPVVVNPSNSYYY
jgi:hypothetical protein